MAYVDGFVIAVPTARKQQFIDYRARPTALAAVTFSMRRPEARRPTIRGAAPGAREDVGRISGRLGAIWTRFCKQK